MTICFVIFQIIIKVSIHTPTKGVTALMLLVSILNRCFNPHTHEGCDIHTPSGKHCLMVSIHTPTKGVTRAKIQIYRKNIVFQSTHPRRVWLSAAIISIIVPQFQSTHPRRVWLNFTFLSNSLSSFNPHTHEGCDTSNLHLLHIRYVSIHTPTKGVTRCSLHSGQETMVSIHTPTKGVTNIDI